MKNDKINNLFNILYLKTLESLRINWSGVVWMDLPYYHHLKYQASIFRASHVALVVKNPPSNERDVRDLDSIPGLGKFPGGGHDNPLQYSCLEDATVRGAWWATVHGVAKSWTQLKWLSMHACMQASCIFLDKLILFGSASKIVSFVLLMLWLIS